MLTSISAKKMTSQERKDMERSAKKHANKTKLWVAVNDKGSKTKRGKWAGNATFQWKGEDGKHAEEIPLRTGDHLKLQGKELWVHPKEGEPFQYAGKKDEDEEKPEADDEATDDEKPDEEAPKKKTKPKKKASDDEDDDDEEDQFDDEEGLGPLTPEEIAADDEEEAIAAEEEKLKLRKTALKADKVARAAQRQAAAARDKLAAAGIGTKLQTQVKEEGVEKTSKSLAGKITGLAGKLALKGFVKAVLFLGAAIQSSDALKQLGPAVKAELAAQRKALEDKGEDIIDAEFTVLENLKAMDNPKLLTSGPLAPAEDADVDSIAELQKKHGIGLADAKLMHERLVKKQKDDEAAAAARAAKPPPLPKKTKKPPMEDNEGIPSVSELQKKHGIGYGPATRMQEKLRKERDENLPMADDEDVVAASLRRVQAALKNVQAFNKRQALPKDAKFVTTVSGQDVYAVDEWFYWVDPKTGEVTQIELQKHSPVLQKYLKKGFLSRLAAASDKPVDGYKIIDNLGRYAVKTLQNFVANLPSEAEASEYTRFKIEEPPPRGGYGPYVVGTVTFRAELKNSARPSDVDFALVMTFDKSKGDLFVGGRSGPHRLESLSQSGPPNHGSTMVDKVLESFQRSLKESVKKLKPVEAPTSEGGKPWSVVLMNDGYASDVQVFPSKEAAMREAKSAGDVYVVEGTQMWNEPLGQVEEHDKVARSQYVRE